MPNQFNVFNLTKQSRTVVHTDYVAEIEKDAENLKQHLQEQYPGDTFVIFPYRVVKDEALFEKINGMNWKEGKVAVQQNAPNPFGGSKKSKNELNELLKNLLGTVPEKDPDADIN